MSAPRQPKPQDDQREPLVVVEVLGGLGNQMFQYAAAWALARRTGARLKLDPRRVGVSGLRRLELGVWSAPTEIASTEEIERVRRDRPVRRSIRRLSRLAGHPLLDVYIESTSGYDQRVADLRPPVYLHGYFQSPRYFDDYAAEIRRLFTPRTPLSREAEDVARVIEATEEPVAVHVRRGDFVHRPQTRVIHDVLDEGYYDSAFALVDELTDRDAHFFVFSDEPAYVRARFAGRARITVVDGAARRPHEDMILISRCRHAVIANSSFSWWGAWLTNRPDKVVVAPSRWTSRDAELGRSLVDLYPAGWTRI